MQYSIRKAKDAFGELKDSLDAIMARYAFPPFTPGSELDSVINIPDGKVFYMTVIEVENTSGSDIKFHIEDDSQNKLSSTYTVASGPTTPINYIGQGMTGKIHFIIESGSYGSVTFRPAGYMGSK